MSARARKQATVTPIKTAPAHATFKEPVIMEPGVIPTDLDFTTCRIARHNWDPFTAHRMGARYVVTLICRRCYTRKVFGITLRGDKIPGAYRYIYEEGYLRTGLGRPSESDMRDYNLAMIKKWFPDV